MQKRKCLHPRFGIGFGMRRDGFAEWFGDHGIDILMPSLFTLLLLFCLQDSWDARYYPGNIQDGLYQGDPLVFLELRR